MEPFCNRHIIFLLFFVIIGKSVCFPQEGKSFYYENEFDLSTDLNKDWSMEIGLGNRGLLMQNQDGVPSGYQHKHVEISHFTGYNLKEFFMISLGLRYRLKELFDPSETNEFRIIEQVEIGSPDFFIPLSHRLRLEQRFRENTVHRIRYELQYNNPINEIFSWSAATEMLYAVSPHLKPEAEQRFSLGIENSSFKDLTIELNLQYRLENYARALAHEFFIITGVSLSL